MQVKTVELRDAATFVPALAIKLDPTSEADRYLLARAGYGPDPAQYVLLCGLDGGVDKITCDPYDWDGNRTRVIAHQWLIQHFEEIQSGDVIDVEFIQGQTKEPKKSERFNEEYPL